MPFKPPHKSTRESSRKNPTAQSLGRKVFRKPTPERLANVALYYLARYAASEASLRRVLENRVRRAAMQNEAFAADSAAHAALSIAIDKIIAQHKASGVVNDAAFAEMKVASLRRAGRSAKTITQKLAVKGIKARQTISALDAHEEDAGGDQELAAALRLAKRRKIGRFRAAPLPNDLPRDALAKLKNKEVSTLARAGFSFDIIRKALDADIDDGWGVGEGSVFDNLICDAG